MAVALRRCLVGGLALVAVAAGLVTPAGAANAPTQLLLPQSTAFSILGYWCGGIQERAYATQFDPSSGYPMGVTHLQTTCNGSGKGGRSTTYTAWSSATWDFTGAVVTSARLATVPTVDPAFSATDANGNQLYNASNNAYLTLATGFVPAARLTSLSVSDGPSTGGTSVGIAGTGFTAATSVDFGSTPAASFVVNGPNSITAVTPPTGAGTVDVTVTTAGGSSAIVAADRFTLVAAPIVTQVSPTSGPIAGGTTVTLSGQHLSAVSAVFLGDQQVGFTSISDAEITLVTPAGESPDSLEIYVSSLGGQSPTSGATQFTYLAPGPMASSSPAAAAPGTSITVSGSGYGASETVKVTYLTGLHSPHPASVALCAVRASTTGTFACKGVIRKATAGAKGAHTMVARGATSHRTATFRFKLT